MMKYLENKAENYNRSLLSSIFSEHCKGKEPKTRLQSGLADFSNAEEHALTECLPDQTPKEDYCYQQDGSQEKYSIDCQDLDEDSCQSDSEVGDCQKLNTMRAALLRKSLLVYFTPSQQSKPPEKNSVFVTGFTSRLPSSWTPFHSLLLPQYSQPPKYPPGKGYCHQGGSQDDFLIDCEEDFDKEGCQSVSEAQYQGDRQKWKAAVSLIQRVWTPLWQLVQQPSSNTRPLRKNSGRTTRLSSSAAPHFLPSQHLTPPGYSSGKGRCSLAMLVLALQMLILPSSAQIGVFPSQTVSGLGGDVAFTCTSLSSRNLSGVEWLINGSSLNDDHRRDGVTQEHDTVLRFGNASIEYNNTRIQCRVDNVLSPESATLLVQGLLSAVGSLLVDARVDHIYVNWTAPFTLDIAFSSVDITYCVDVVSSISSATLHSECGITETEFTYPLPPRSWCDEYNFAVTPVNVAGNGTKNSMLYLQDILGPRLSEANVGNSGVSLVMSAPVCQAEVLARDVHTKEYHILREPDVTIAEANISFPSELLTLNRRYSLTISANNIGGQIMSGENISTHDIISCTTNSNSDIISISVEFTEHSEATGALLNFIFITEDGVIDFSKSVSFAANKTGVLQGLTLPMSMWYSGQYILYVYDIEGDKMIMNGVQYPASSVSSLTVTNGQAGSVTPTSVMNCTVDSDAQVITVACSFLFQVTAQLNALDSVNILHVNTSMDPQTPVTLQVTENGEYLVTILPVQDGRGIISAEMQTRIINTVTTQSPVTFNPTIRSSSDVTGIAVGIVVGLAVIVIVVVVLSLMITTTHNKKLLKRRENVYVEAQVRGESDSITVRMSRSGPSTTTSTQDDEPAYAMVHDVTSDVRSYSPADIVESSVQQGSVKPELTQGHLEEANIPTYSVVKKPHKKTPPSAGTEPSHPPPFYDSVILPPHKTFTPIAVPNESTCPEAMNSSATPLITDSSESLAATPLSAEGRSGQSAEDCYVALDHFEMDTSPGVINVHLTSSEYAVPTGYKNEQNRTYAFVELKAGRDTQHKLELTNDVETVVYSEVASQA